MATGSARAAVRRAGATAACASALSHLEVRLLQDAHQLVGRLAAVGDGAQLLQDVLHQLHVVLTHRLQFGFLKLLVSLVGSITHRRVMRGKKRSCGEIENGSAV